MKVLFVAGTNFELYYLSSIAYLLQRKSSSVECVLMLRRNFEKNITPEIRGLYSRIELFDIPTLSFPVSKNPATTLKNFVLNIKDSIHFRTSARKMLSDFDAVCICGFKEFFANIMAKQAPTHTRLVVLRLANQRLDETQKFRKRALLSFILNLKNRIFGYSMMEYKWRPSGGLDPVTKNFVRYPFHQTISITDYDITTEDAYRRLPPPFVALKQLYKQDNSTPSIVLAGDKTPFYEGWTAEDEKTYASVFAFLRKNFPNHKLYFKPKMGRTDPSKYNLEGFELLPAEVSLEEFCLRNNVKKVISIRSTASKMGVYFGIPGYMLYPLFAVPSSFREEIENEHYDMRSVVRVSKLEDMLQEPQLFTEQYGLSALADMYWQAIVPQQKL